MLWNRAVSIKNAYKWALCGRWNHLALWEVDRVSFPLSRNLWWWLQTNTWESRVYFWSLRHMCFLMGDVPGFASEEVQLIGTRGGWKRGELWSPVATQKSLVHLTSLWMCFCCFLFFFGQASHRNFSYVYYPSLWKYPTSFMKNDGDDSRSDFPWRLRSFRAVISLDFRRLCKIAGRANL